MAIVITRACVCVCVSVGGVKYDCCGGLMEEEEVGERKMSLN